MPLTSRKMLKVTRFKSRHFCHSLRGEFGDNGTTTTKLKQWDLRTFSKHRLVFPRFFPNIVLTTTKPLLYKKRMSSMIKKDKTAHHWRNRKQPSTTSNKITPGATAAKKIS